MAVIRMLQSRPVVVTVGNSVSSMVVFLLDAAKKLISSEFINTCPMQSVWPVTDDKVILHRNDASGRSPVSIRVAALVSS